MDKNWKALREEVPVADAQAQRVHRRDIRLTTQPIEEPDNDAHLLQIFEMMDAEHTLMFSSDYPHWDFDSPEQAFPRLPAGPQAAHLRRERARALWSIGSRTAQPEVGVILSPQAKNLIILRIDSLVGRDSSFLGIDASWQVRSAILRTRFMTRRDFGRGWAESFPPGPG